MLELKKGFNVKIDNAFYKILNYEDLIYKSAAVTVATLANTIVDETNLQPLDDEIYHIKEIGIQGGLSFQLQFPRGVPRNTPKGQQIFYDKYNASYLNPVQLEFFIRSKVYPSIYYYNAEAISQTAFLHIRGAKYKVTQIPQPISENWSDLSDFTTIGV